MNGFQRRATKLCSGSARNISFSKLITHSSVRSNLSHFSSPMPLPHTLFFDLMGIYFLLCFGLLVYKPQQWFDLSSYHLRPGSHSFSYTLNSSMESFTSSESPSQMKTILYDFCCFCQELQRKSQSCVDQHHGTNVNPMPAGPHQCPLMLSPRSRHLPYMFTAMSALKLCHHQSPIPTVLAP